MARVPWSQRLQANAALKLSTGQTARLAMLDETPEMIRSHYFGRQYQCTHPDCFWCENSIEWKERFAAYVLLYNQDAQANLQSPLDGVVVPWFFGSDKFMILHAWARIKDVRMEDIFATCIEDRYQKFALDRSGAPALWIADQAFVAKVQGMHAAMPKDLSSKIAMKVTRAEAVTIFQRGPGGDRDRQRSPGPRPGPTPGQAGMPPGLAPSFAPPFASPAPAPAAPAPAFPGMTPPAAGFPAMAPSAPPQPPAFPSAPSPAPVPTPPVMLPTPPAPTAVIPPAAPEMSVQDRMKKLLENF